MLALIGTAFTHRGIGMMNFRRLRVLLLPTLGLLLLAGCATPTQTPMSTSTAPADSAREPTRLGISFDPEISSAEVQSWVELAVGEMQDPATDFLGLIWPIGSQVDDEPDPQLFDGAFFSEHEHVLSPDQITETVEHFVNWRC